MAKLVGYARVSTEDQDLSLQCDALQREGCREDLIFVDTASGANAERPGLEVCLKAVERGDTLVVQTEEHGQRFCYNVPVISG